MDQTLARILEATGASSVRRGERIQSLWGGYGELFRVTLGGAKEVRAVVKSVKPPASPRGSISHERKCHSYEVEIAFYRSFARECPLACRVPLHLGSRPSANGGVLVLEDLDAAGYSRRARILDHQRLRQCLAWLAAFHATFLNVAPTGLWTTGTYWHLGTRPEELARVEDPALADAAVHLDEKLNRARFKTLVHGDAKTTNFCFSEDGRSVAAVDFQYVGGGVGVKDVAYLLSCLPDPTPAEMAPYVELYFECLRRSLSARTEENDVDALEGEWRTLFPLAFADFYRFLAGWSKDAWNREKNARAFVHEILRTELRFAR